MSKDYHSKGQKDGSQGKYKPPHGIVDDLATWSTSGMKKNARETNEYNKGQKNAKRQKGSK